MWKDDKAWESHNLVEAADSEPCKTLEVGVQGARNGQLAADLDQRTHSVSSVSL